MKRVFAALVLLGLIAVACAPSVAPTPPPPVKETLIVEKVVTPTPRPVQQGSILKIEPQAEDAVLQIMPVAANATDPNVMTATVKIITSTIVGPANVVVQMGSTGLTNEPVNVPIHLAVNPPDPKNPPKSVKWTLSAPPGAKSTIKDPTAMATEFTPDVVGFYKVDLAMTDAAGKTKVESVQVHAGTYIGVTDGNCVQCHPQKVAEWQKTGHADIFSDNIDNKRTPNADTHYTENCARCHTTGYFAPGANDGGFKDAMNKTNWNIPTWDKINAAGKDASASNWNNAPAAIKNMGNIQCEQCHGPANEHVTKGEKVMVSSQDEGVCNVCHNGGGHHLKGTDLKNAKHSDAKAAAFTTPVGPEEQACVRCHSGNGYVTFLRDPKNPAGWDNSAQTIVCSTCHDPHDEANMFQLRIVGKPVEITFDAKDVGLSATCFECHNARVKAADAIKGSFPHYNSIAEFLSDTGGVEYGQKIANSPHSQIVGVGPIANPAFAKDPTTNQFMFSKAGDAKGNVPGPCVTCHMWPTIEDAKDPNFHKVGSHSFNTVSPDGKFDYTAACQSCHAGLKDFNMPAKADYDGNGKVEGDQDEVKGLLNALWKQLEAKGLKKVDSGYPYATLPRDASGTIDPKVANAWYNFRTVYGVMWGAETGNGDEGKAQAVHNLKRSVMLLQLSYKDLTGTDIPNATLLK